MSDGGSIQANPLEILNYGARLFGDVTGQMGSMWQSFGDVADNLPTAFAQMPALMTGQFPEAVTAMHYAMRNFHQFQQFFQDMIGGMQAIQSAAVTVAVTYATTDSNSANSVNAVDFAFADGGKPMQGFPTKGISTIEAQREAQAAASGRNTMAAAAAQDQSMLAGMTPKTTADGAVYTFADGSQLTVFNYGGSSIATGRTVTVTDPTSPHMKRTTSTSSVSYGGDQIDTTTDDVVGADGTHTSTTVQVTTHQDGSVETTTTTDDGTGKAPTVVHSHSDPPPKNQDTSASMPDGATKQQQHLGVDNAGTQLGQ